MSLHCISSVRDTTLSLETPAGARPHDSRNSSPTPTCVIGSRPPAPAGPRSGSIRSSSGCKSLQGMPFGLSGSAHGSFLGNVVGRTGSGEQERRQKLLALALPALLWGLVHPVLSTKSTHSSSGQQTVVRTQLPFLLTWFSFRNPSVSVSSVILLLPHAT